MSLRRQTKKWQTKDGRKLRICDMDDGHLVNAMRMLRKYAKLLRLKTVHFYVRCVGPTGEMAQVAFDEELDRVLSSGDEDYLPEIYDNMVADCQRRDIKYDREEFT